MPDEGYCRTMTVNQDDTMDREATQKVKTPQLDFCLLTVSRTALNDETGNKWWERLKKGMLVFWVIPLT